MSNIIFDFLTESMLFSDFSIDNNFSNYTDKELKLELRRYREYVLKNIDNILSETKDDFSNLSVYTEMYSSNKIDINMLKQGSLYVHKFILKDPIFEYTKSLEKSKIVDHFNQFMGMSGSDELDRVQLTKDVKYVKALTSAVAYGFVKFIPGSIIHEGPKEIPLLYSSTGFSDALPNEIMNFFRERSMVHSLEKIDSGYAIRIDKPLNPCRVIAVEFKGYPQSIKIYSLVETKAKIINEEEKIVRFICTLPDSVPSIDEFNAWVNQSINQAAIGVFRDIYKEIMLSTQLNATFLTQSELVNEMLRLSLPVKDSISSYTLNSLLNIDLPIIDDISLDSLLKVRYEDGEAFENLRIYLEKQFRDLRTITDENLLKKRIDNIMHELNEVQVREVDLKVKSLLKKFFINSSLLGLSLVGTFFASGVSLFPIIIALVSGYKNYNEYISQVKENPAYLLWKVKGKRTL